MDDYDKEQHVTGLLTESVELIMQAFGKVTPVCGCPDPGCADNRQQMLEMTALKALDGYTMFLSNVMEINVAIAELGRIAENN